MAIKPLGRHYSMENPASVYDEEALTALELAGRTTAKVNEVVEYVNQLPEQIRVGVAEKILEHIQAGTFNQAIDEHYNITLEGRLTELTVRMNEIVASAGDNNTEIVDMRTGADRMSYPTAGDAVRKQFKIVSEAVTASASKPVITVTDIRAGEYYSTTNGGWGVSETWKRSANLYPCTEGVILVCPEMTEPNQVQVACYDREFSFLGFVHAVNSSCPGVVVKATMPGTVFIGVTVKNTNLAKSWTLRALDATVLDYIEDPFTGKDVNYIVYDNYYMHSSGNPAVSDAYKTVVFPVDGAKTLFTNASIETNAIFYGADGAMIDNGATYNQHTVGRSYPVPGGAVYCAFNILKSHTYKTNASADENSKLSQYVALIRPADNKPLAGKKVLCIGDSITWLDGKSGFGNSTDYRGWQAELAKRGALVDTIGYSGLGYAGIDSTTSIYHRIQEDNPQATYNKDYDAVVLFAGSNDIAKASPYFNGTMFKIKMKQTPHDTLVGQEGWVDNMPVDNWNSPSTWEGDFTLYNEDGTTVSSTGFFEWGLHNLVKWVYETYPNATIYLCTPMFRASVSAIGKYNDYIKAIHSEAHTSACQVIDLYHKAGVAYHNYARAYYDQVHPTCNTMAKIGRIIANEIEGSI